MLFDNVYKHSSAKYVVDGFEVSMKLNNQSNGGKSTGAVSGEALPTPRTSSGNSSTFLEINKLNTSHDQDKGFQKRNDFEYWPATDYVPSHGQHINPLAAYLDSRHTYLKNRFQNTEPLLLTNSNPYLPKLSNHKKPEKVYLYETPTPYRSRYRERYTEGNLRLEDTMPTYKESKLTNTNDAPVVSKLHSVDLKSILEKGKSLLIVCLNSLLVFREYF